MGRRWVLGAAGLVVGAVVVAGLAGTAGALAEPLPVLGPVVVSPSALEVPAIYEQGALVASEASPCHVSPDVLLAVAWVEHGYVLGAASTSFAGAEGPMQFEPATWAAYEHLMAALSVPGGSTPPSVENVPDALTAAAIMLCSDGASPGGWSAGDARAVGVYNCGGTWVSDPGACVTVEGGHVVDTTAAYVARVEATATALAAHHIPSGSTSQPAPAATSPVPAWVSAGAPGEGELGIAAAILGQQVDTGLRGDREVVEIVCGGAGLPTTLGGPAAPALGDVAVWPGGEGIVVAGVRRRSYVVEEAAGGVVTTAPAPQQARLLGC